MLRVAHKIIIQAYYKILIESTCFSKKSVEIAMKIIMCKKYTQTNRTTECKTCRTPSSDYKTSTLDVVLTPIRRRRRAGYKTLWIPDSYKTDSMILGQTSYLFHLHCVEHRISIIQSNSQFNLSSMTGKHNV